MFKISDAELDIMNIIWEKEEVTSSEIITKLKEKKWTNSTVRTLIRRLMEKKAIEISKEERKKYYYIALIDKEEYKSYLSQAFVSQLFNGSFVEFVSFFIEKKELSYKELEIIREKIKKIS